MADRREFLRYAMVSAVPLATGLSLEAAAQSALSPIRRIVIDARHVECLAFGASLAEEGATIHALPDGDVTNLWLTVIQPLWARTPEPVAGLTRSPALFVLEQLAWPHGLRVVHHAEHAVSPVAPAIHEIHREGVVLTRGQLDRLDTLWPERVAESIANRRRPLAASRPGPTAAGLAPALPAGRELLTSWVIAPA